MQRKVRLKMEQWIQHKYSTLLFIINNQKIRTKMLYLYLFCVLVPVLVTNIFIIGNMMEISKKEMQDNINNIAESIAQDINSSLENAVYVTVDLYVNNSIYNFLDKSYRNSTDFIKGYNKVFDNYVFYATSKHLIGFMNFYSDNPTMVNGGRYYRIDTIKQEEWYQKFMESGSDLFIYSYYNDTNNVQTNNRMFSIIRRLDYVGLHNVEKLVKLDLNYSKITEDIKNYAFDTTVYVVHGDKIIFTNDANDLGDRVDYMNSTAIDMKKVQLHKAMSSYGYDFDIYLAGYKSNYSMVFRKNVWLILVLLLADACIPAVTLSLFSKSITKRILMLGAYLKKVKGEEFELITGNKGNDEIGELLDNYNHMTSKMKNLIEYEYKCKLEQQELHLARQQAELLALHSQINPHFMFNVLETIRMHCVIKGEEETSRMVESLARLMRKSAQWGEDLITIEQEIEFTEDYLKLQKHRFGSEFYYKFRVGEDCNKYMIPSLVLATFVENSCVHGLDREGHRGTIFISVYKEDDCLCIEVEDTGVGMEPEQVSKLEELLNDADIDKLQKSESLGMLNACVRLKKYYGEEIRICIDSEKQVGTSIMIEMPLKE
ncbi:MAG TPA: sensor histidine kinase [Lachnospiraceae bacterium]|nr:sensor histidine kinase [Lachnospiraceae bacterium]